MTDHRILLKKNSVYEIRAVSSGGMYEYLHMEKLEQGVLQRSVLGQFLFVIYVNDLPKNITVDTTCLFVDDTTFGNIDKNEEIFQLKRLQCIEEVKICHAHLTRTRKSG